MILSKDKRMDLRNTLNFKKTNKIWNDLNLNQAWCIGYLMQLCKNSKASSFDEWESYYFESGRLRAIKISVIPVFKKQILMDRKVYLNNNLYKIDMLSKQEKRLNTHMGRTREDLFEIARDLFKGVKNSGISDISLEDCENYVYIRVIDETWIGIQREINTKESLQKLLKGYEIKDVSLRIDVKYAVDFEVYKNNKLILALQVKSKKYQLDKKEALIKTKNFNNLKNSEYTKINKVPVIDVFSDFSGYIYNPEDVISKLIIS